MRVRLPVSLMDFIMQAVGRKGIQTMKPSVFVLFMLLVTSPGFAEGPREQTLHQLERREAMDNAINALKELETIDEHRSAMKRHKCIQVFGQETFCDCLIKNTPAVSSFEDYVAAVVPSDQELNFAHLKPQQKKLVMLNRRARNQCVNASQTPP